MPGAQMHQSVCAHCPPNTLLPKELREILKDYQKAILFIMDFPSNIMGIDMDTINDLMAGYRGLAGSSAKLNQRLSMTAITWPLAFRRARADIIFVCRTRPVGNVRG